MHALTAFLVRQQRRGEADQLIGDWIRRDPKSAAAYAEYGWLCARTRITRASSACQHASGLDPHDVHALNQLGRY